MSDRYTRFDLVSLVTPGDRDDAVRQAADDFLHHLHDRNYSVRTIEERRKNLKLLVAWAKSVGIATPEQFSRPDLERFRAWLRSERLSHGGTPKVSTQRQILTSVLVFFRFLDRAGRVASNPAQHLELPRQERAMPTPALTRAEVDCLLAQPDLTNWYGVRDRAIMETLFATGIRRQELARLEIADVNFEQRILTVHHGKGKRARMVPISDRALGWIDRYLAVRPGALDPNEAGVLFLSSKRQTFGLICLSRKITGYVRQAGLDKKGSCHMFRATTATLMLEGGADIRFIQEMLGHASITSTQKYARVSIGALQRVYAAAHPSALDDGSVETPVPPKAITLALPLSDDAKAS